MKYYLRLITETKVDESHCRFTTVKTSGLVSLEEIIDIIATHDREGKILSFHATTYLPEFP